MQLFKKKETDDSVVAKKNWYADRYQTVVVQRNFLLLLTMISLAGIIVSAIAVIKVTSSKTIEPFVIEIEEKTGITNVIRPLLKEKFSHEEALTRYFIMKYINARETYDPSSFEYNYSTVARILSSSEVYSQFRRSISADNPESPLRLGLKGERTIKVISITPLVVAAGQTGFTAQVRFVATSTASTPKNLVATINYLYQDLELNRDERDINPLGFQVTGYRIDEEAL
jgi:type IV secretion system protein VirB8